MPGKGGMRPGHPPHEQARQRTGPRQDTRRGTDRVERSYRRPAPEPRRMRTPHRPGERGRARTPRECGRTHTQRTHGEYQKGNRTEPAYQRARVRDPRTGQPATRSAGNAGRERGIGEDTEPGTGPRPPRPAASAAHVRTEHCTRQGSSGVPSHAPTPRLGSLRASPGGSDWRQASSTGQAAPAPRSTTH